MDVVRSMWRSRMVDLSLAHTRSVGSRLKEKWNMRPR